MWHYEAGILTLCGYQKVLLVEETSCVIAFPHYLLRIDGLQLRLIYYAKEEVQLAGVLHSLKFDHE